MKTNPKRYLSVLSLAPRLVPVIPEGSAARNRRRVESGVRAFFAVRSGNWMTELRADQPIEPRTRVN
jgi:hypothetical protein